MQSYPTSTIINQERSDRSSSTLNTRSTARRPFNSLRRQARMDSDDGLLTNRSKEPGLSANRSSENLMTQDNHSKLSFPSSARPASTSSMMKRPSLSYSETPARPSTSPSSARPSNNSLPTPRSRLPNPPSKSFGFSHNI